CRRPPACVDRSGSGDPEGCVFQPDFRNQGMLFLLFQSAAATHWTARGASMRIGFGGKGGRRLRKGPQGNAGADMTRVAAPRNSSVSVRSASSCPGVVRALLAGLAIFFVCAFPAAQSGGARAEDQLRVITTGDYSPFVYTDASGALTGF